MNKITVEQIEPNSIMIADDSKTVVTLHSKYAQTASPGISIQTAYDGSVAWDLFQKQPTAVAMLDIDMPGINGVDLSEKIYRFSPSTGIIVFSGKLNQQIMLKFASIEVDFSKKPADEFGVAIKIRAALRRFEKDLVLEKMKACARLTADLNSKEFDLAAIKLMRDIVSDRKFKDKFGLIQEILKLDINEFRNIENIMCHEKRGTMLDLVRKICLLEDPRSMKLVADVAYGREIDFT